MIDQDAVIDDHVRDVIDDVRDLIDQVQDVIDHVRDVIDHVGRAAISSSDHGIGASAFTIVEKRRIVAADDAIAHDADVIDHVRRPDRR